MRVIRDRFGYLIIEHRAPAFHGFRRRTVTRSSVTRYANGRRGNTVCGAWRFVQGFTHATPI